LCSISRQPIWAGARSDNFTRRSREPPGSKRRQLARQVGVEPTTFCLGNRRPISTPDLLLRKQLGRGILRYLPAPDQGQSCLRGGPSGLGPRRHRRGSPRYRLRRRSHLGRPGRRRDGLPMRRHDDPRINLLYGWHGRLLLGDKRVGLTPQGHLNYLGQGVKYPLGLPPLLGPGPRWPSPRCRRLQPTWRLAR
jgi:hypothetical protein